MRFDSRRVWGVRSPKHAAVLCVGTTEKVRVPQFWIAVAHGKEPPISFGVRHLGLTVALKLKKSNEKRRSLGKISIFL
jgi:hypothetical protein